MRLFFIKNLHICYFCCTSARPFPSYVSQTQGGFPPKVCSRPAGYMQGCSFFLQPLHSSLQIMAHLRPRRIGIYAIRTAFLWGIYAIRRVKRRAIIAEFYSALQKKCSKTCIYAIFVVPLQPNCANILNLTDNENDKNHSYLCAEPCSCADGYLLRTERYNPY